jgi:putative transcriptional regulator
LALQVAIMANPKSGCVVPGTGGLRKLEFAPPKGLGGKNEESAIHVECATSILKSFIRFCSWLPIQKVAKKISLTPKRRLSKKRSKEFTTVCRQDTSDNNDLMPRNTQMMEGKKAMKRSLGKTVADRLNEFAEALESGKPLSAKFTCRKVVLNLLPMPYSPAIVKKTRAILGASQSIFAQFLGVSVDTVQAWERGANSPSDMACRFMDEIRHNPTYWRKRLMDSVSQKIEEPAVV